MCNASLERKYLFTFLMTKYLNSSSSLNSVVGNTFYTKKIHFCLNIFFSKSALSFVYIAFGDGPWNDTDYDISLISGIICIYISIY